MNLKHFPKFAFVLVAALFLVGCTNNPSTSNTDTDNTDYTGIDSGSNATQKPSGWPASVPTVSGASDFEYALLGGTYYLGYAIDGESINQVTSSVRDSLVQAGWTAPADGGFESNEGSLLSLTKDDQAITLAIGPADDGSGKYQVAIVMGSQTEE